MSLNCYIHPERQTARVVSVAGCDYEVCRECNAESIRKRLAVEVELDEIADPKRYARLAIEKHLQDSIGDWQPHLVTAIERLLTLIEKMEDPLQGDYKKGKELGLKFVLSNDPEMYEIYRDGSNEPSSDHDEYVRFGLTFDGEVLPDYHLSGSLPESLRDRIGEYQESQFEFRGQENELVELLGLYGISSVTEGWWFDDARLWRRPGDLPFWKDEDFDSWGS